MPARNPAQASQRAIHAGRRPWSEGLKTARYALMGSRSFPGLGGARQGEKAAVE
jgi:hypothetical protein